MFYFKVEVLGGSGAGDRVLVAGVLAELLMGNLAAEQMQLGFGVKRVLTSCAWRSSLRKGGTNALRDARTLLP